MPSSVLKGTCASLSLRGLHSLVFYFVHSCTCASACFELNVALISPCSQWSFVVHMGMDPPCLGCSTFLHSSMVSVLFIPPPPAPLVSTEYIRTISVTCAHLPFRVGAHGWVVRICLPWEQSHLGAGCQ